MVDRPAGPACQHHSRYTYPYQSLSMMKFKSLLVCLFISSSLLAQNLKSFSANMRADSLCYLSIKNNKAYTAGQADQVKTVLDLGLFVTVNDKSLITEWYNLKPDNEKVPAGLTGTQTKVAAISFDRDQFDKCKTVADLKRMTGYLSSNSFSHFAVVQNTGEYYQRCFIVERQGGIRGLIFVTPLGKGWKVEVKTAL